MYYNLKSAKLTLAFLLILSSICINAKEVFVSPSGDDNNQGIINSPFKTITKAISISNPGDTIYLRNGVYYYSNTLYIQKSGVQERYFHIFAYENEKPILDFYGESFGSRGIVLKGSYWHIRGLEVKGAGDNGLYIDDGSRNIIENCSFHDNNDSGVQLGHGASYNKFINCDSYYNADPPDYEDADGFAPKLDVGTGNYFYGCRAWGNCDDGWDGYLRSTTGVSATLENCWSFKNGWLKDGTNPENGDGNGFKMGGNKLRYHFTLIRCIAADNKNKGFDQNNNRGSMTLYNCSSYGNLKSNYRIKEELDSGNKLIIKNCLSYNGKVELGNFAIQSANSWTGGIHLSDDDFTSLSTSDLEKPRKEDGSLPDIDFLKPSPESDLIDAGVDVGIEYHGYAPDIGAIETNYETKIALNEGYIKYKEILNNYPNPFNFSTIIEYFLEKPGKVNLIIYDILGRSIKILTSEYRTKGKYNTIWYPDHNTPSGLYLITLEINNQIYIKKVLYNK
ncbi:MAG: right-handed parallel beta-helix repeat-containing protein [Candidatus Marinimicrobia bacterium]|nr:right-handed parallel beta-helix repeat-containing protein [Candidatus Neomarinimicrobiota bacterium]